MTGMFLKLLNMSIAASWLVLAVLILRLVLKKTPKWITCLLWGIVALRLILPVYMESGFSLIPSSQVIPQDIATTQVPAIHSGISAVNSAVNSAMTQQVIQGENPMELLISKAAVIWVFGAVAVLLYGAVSTLRLRWKVRASILLRENIYFCDNVASPFVFGFFMPKIYIPSGIEESQLPYILAHENAHIRRRDHWWKPISYFLLAVYWFNPLFWVAHILLCRDIERACDEKVIADMDNAQKKGYSQALVACSVHRRTVMVCPVAFGEIGVKTRIKGVFGYKKPALWLILGSAAICAATAVCFLTNPKACSHEYHSQVVQASTCTQKGMENRTCRLCNHCYAVPMEVCAHTYDEGVVIQAPTCIEQGWKEFSCIDCGAKKTEHIDITAHIDGELVVSVEPNCSQQGQVTTACTYCNAPYVVEILPTNDVHELQETVTKEPTCTQKGEGIKQCTRCDYSESVTYQATGHHYVLTHTQEGRCGFEGYAYWKCSVCRGMHIESLGTGSHLWRSTVNGRKKCEYCGMITSENSDSFYGYSGNSSGTTQLPGIIWDVADSMRPTP